MSSERRTNFATRSITSPLRFVLVRLALVVAGTAAALALAGPLALRPFVDAAGAASDVAVAFVVDLGPAGGPVTGCVKVPSTANRYDALSAFLAQKGLEAPTFNSSGLLCSINGIPTSGCGQTVAGGYVYWAYYTGNGHKWVYANAGAFDPVGPDDVEGWRFQDPGTGRPNDPPPPVAPRYASLCRAVNTTTTTSRPVRPAGGYRTTTTTVAGTTTTNRATNKATTTTTTTTTTTSTVGSFPTGGGSSSQDGGSSGSSSSDGSSSGDTTDTTFPQDPVVKSTPATSYTNWPNLASITLGILLIVGLGIAGFLRWRKRPRTP